jgi:hypothetical protein
MQKAVNKQLFLVLQNTTLCILTMLFFSLPAHAQNDFAKPDVDSSKHNPLFIAALKKPIKANPILAERIKPTKHELMYWPNFPLTAAQIEARDRLRNRSIGRQISEDIIKNYVNTLIYGKKIPPAVIPKF